MLPQSTKDDRSEHLPEAWHDHLQRHTDEFVSETKRSLEQGNLFNKLSFSPTEVVFGLSFVCPSPLRFSLSPRWAPLHMGYIGMYG